MSRRARVTLRTTPLGAAAMTPVLPPAPWTAWDSSMGPSVVTGLLMIPLLAMTALFAAARSLRACARAFCFLSDAAAARLAASRNEASRSCSTGAASASASASRGAVISVNRLLPSSPRQTLGWSEGAPLDDDTDVRGADVRGAGRRDGRSRCVGVGYAPVSSVGSRRAA